MPSRRMIDPTLWESQTIAQYSFFERLFFIGLFSNADDQGRLHAHPALLRSKIFPYDDLGLSEIEQALNRFIENRAIHVYEVDGQRYVQILNWWKWQQARWARPSKLPPPPKWKDRHCYRIGNAPIYRNWPGCDDTPEPDTAEEWDQSGTTMEPERDQNGEPEIPAPSLVFDQSMSSSTGSLGEGTENQAAPAAPTPKPPPRKREPKPKTPTPPAITAFRTAINRYPAKPLWDGIVQIVGDEPADVERWERTARAWLAMGWNPTNVKGMLQHFTENRIPGDDRAGGKQGKKSEPDNLSGVRAWAEKQGVEWPLQTP